MKSSNHNLTTILSCLALIVCSSAAVAQDEVILQATPERHERDSCTVSNVFETCDKECGKCETCRTLNYVQVEIESESGIGRAKLSRFLSDEASNDETPSFAIHFVLHLRGLEGFSLATEDATFRLEVPSSNPHMRLVSIREKDENASNGWTEMKIGPDNVRYPTVHVFNVDDEELTDKLPGRSGRFEVTLPAPLVDEILKKEARLQWIDFYR